MGQLSHVPAPQLCRTFERSSASCWEYGIGYELCGLRSLLGLKVNSPISKLSVCRGVTEGGGRGVQFPTNTEGVHLVNSDAAREAARIGDVSGRWVSRRP
jgi:hypothetical protein